MQDPLGSFIVELIKTKGEPDTPEHRAELLKAANDAVDQAMLEAMSPEQLDKLEAAIKEDNVDDSFIEQLLIEAGAKPDEIMRQALVDFREQYLKGVSNE